MSSTLHDPAVAGVLSRLRRQADEEDPRAATRIRAHEREVGHRVFGQERVDVYAGAPLAISAETGRLLYVLALARGAQRIVEFGTSIGYSTIFLAAALRDAGGGSLITTELSPDKAATATANLAEAGLLDLIDLRVGDARQTLAALDTEVDLLFLDGWNDLYEAVLEVVQPRLAAGAVVVADLSKGYPELDRYRERMLDPSSGYVTSEIPLDDGVVVSVRVTAS
jgi:predicted O-methyltransferase YrrM